MSIERYKMEGISTVNYKCGYPQAEAIHDKLIELGISCTVVTDTYSDLTQGTFTAVINSDFSIFFTCNGSNSTAGPSMQVKGNGSDLGALITCNGYVDSLNHVSYMNIVKTSDKLLIGFSDYNNTGYEFNLCFMQYNNANVCIWLPNTNTALVMYDVNGAIVGTFADMYNIAIPDLNKGLFRSFLVTKSDGYVDLDTIYPEFYDISTGYPLQIDLPVEVNGLQFLPLNNFTLFKLE